MHILRNYFAATVDSDYVHTARTVVPTRSNESLINPHGQSEEIG